VACEALGVLEGDPVELGLRLWAGAHGIAALLIAKPSFPWPPLEELVEATIHAVGLGLAVASRLPEPLRRGSCDDRGQLETFLPPPSYVQRRREHGPDGSDHGPP